jgi:hypothetical protein
VKIGSAASVHRRDLLLFVTSPPRSTDSSHPVTGRRIRESVRHVVSLEVKDIAGDEQQVTSKVNAITRHYHSLRLIHYR